MREIMPAIVQGITEFLPVSSSAHMTFFHISPFYNTLLHAATFCVVFYTLRIKIFAVWQEIVQRRWGKDSLFMKLFLGSLPVVVVGYIAEPYMDDLPLSLLAWNQILFGSLLLYIDYRCAQQYGFENLTLAHACFLGVAQALAVVPGVSRLGITLTALRFCRFSRIEAMYISLFFSLVPSSGALVLKTIKHPGMWAMIGIDELITVMLAVVSGVLGMRCAFLWLRRYSFAMLCFYRVILGIYMLFS